MRRKTRAESQLDISPSEHVTDLRIGPHPAVGQGPILILAHGAGANQTSSFHGPLCHFPRRAWHRHSNFNFVYTEQRRRLPDRNDKLEHCYRTVIEAVRSGKFHDDAGRRKLAIGGKSMGGRIASQVAAAGQEGIAGLVFLGYPLHRRAVPTSLRFEAPARHPRADAVSSRVRANAFGAPEELRAVLGGLGVAGRHLCGGGRRPFLSKVPKRIGGAAGSGVRICS